MIDDQQARRIDEAAREFAEALTESYRTVSGRSTSVAQLNAELTQSFFNGVINNLRAQAESNRETAQGLVDQQQRQAEATRALTQESVSAYMDFVNSIFSYYGGGVAAASETAAAPETAPAAGSTTATPETAPAAPETGPEGQELPLADYDSLNVREVSEKLDDLSVEEIKQLRDYEVRNKNRRTLMDRFNARIEEGSSS